MTVDCYFNSKPGDLLNLEYVAAIALALHPTPHIYEIGHYTRKEIDRFRRERMIIAELIKEPDDAKRKEVFANLERKYKIKVGPKKLATHQQRLELAKKIALKIINGPHFDKVYLVGSTVTGTDRPDSDMDIIGVRKRCSTNNKYTWFQEEQALHNINIDFKCYTRADFKRADRDRPKLLLAKRQVEDIK